VKYPPIAVVASKSFSTQHSAIKDGPNSVLGLSIDSTQKISGDGSVPWTAATAIPSCMT
jgi:hypothetical protein